MATVEVFALALCLAVIPAMAGAAPLPMDVLKTSTGDLTITFVGHGSLIFAWGGKVVYVDPWSSLADYSALPKADLVLVTHDHYDHFDAKAIDAVRKPGKATLILASHAAAARYENAQAIANGGNTTAAGIPVEAVPAYNIIHKRDDGTPYHPRGAGNGYVLAFGDRRVYVAGDTENIPEMKNLGRIDVAFLPVNLPYTMTPAMLADAANMVRPSILYPYHYGETDVGAIKDAMRSAAGVEVRIRPMK